MISNDDIHISVLDPNGKVWNIKTCLTISINDNLEQLWGWNGRLPSERGKSEYNINLVISATIEKMKTLKSSNYLIVNIQDELSFYKYYVKQITTGTMDNGYLSQDIEMNAKKLTNLPDIEFVKTEKYSGRICPDCGKDIDQIRMRCWDCYRIYKKRSF